MPLSAILERLLALSITPTPSTSKSTLDTNVFVLEAEIPVLVLAQDWEHVILSTEKCSFKLAEGRWQHKGFQSLPQRAPPTGTLNQSGRERQTKEVRR